MNLLQFLASHRKMKRLTDLADGKNWTRSKTRIHKHIDENRQLLELLLEDVPELLKKKPWIIAWCEKRDEFSTEFADIMGTENYLPRHDFPRAWPIGEGRQEKKS